MAGAAPPALVPAIADTVRARQRGETHAAATPTTRRCPSASRTSSSRRLRGRQQPDGPDAPSCGRPTRLRSRASTRTACSLRWPQALRSCAPRRPTAPTAPSRCPRAWPSRAPPRYTRATPSSASPPTRDASDDFIVRHPQFTASYNANRGTPNWVAYNLDATHFGAEDRCDCFTFDPALPASFPQLHHRRLHRRRRVPRLRHRSRPPGAFVRPHRRQSRQRAHLLFTNIVPQAADLNQGPWAHLRELPRRRGPRRQGGLHRHRRRGQQGHAEERGQDRHSRRRPGRSR